MAEKFLEKTLSTLTVGVDALAKLRESFKISPKTEELKKKCEQELKQFKFKSFKESSSCKCSRGMDEGRFENFVTRLQQRYNLPEEAKGSILDGLDADENVETVKEFRFKDGNGDIHHGRFVTVKNKGKMDIAYAVYNLSFELAGGNNNEEGVLLWLFKAVYPWCEAVEDGQKELGDTEMDKFSQWCLVKLHNIVQEECGGKKV